MKKIDDLGNDSGTCQNDRPGGQDKEWQPPRLTVWEVVRDTSVQPTKTGSGADSLGMRDINI
jgi:hypothetical protein